jgi:hypothetical protein
MLPIIFPVFDDTTYSVKMKEKPQYIAVFYGADDRV